jgi:hypothetical protein
MADRTLVQNQLKILYSSIQVRDIPACHVFDKSGVARICVSSNLRVQQGIRQCAVLIVANMHNGNLQCEGRVDITNRWEGDIKRFIPMVE